jgi:hypothetical protein
LRTGLSDDAASVLSEVRKALLALNDVQEVFSWYGHSWHWTLEYRTSHSDEPLAVIIPSPEDLQIAVPMDREFSRSLPMKRMKRTIRDGLDLACEPFHTRWAEWSLLPHRLTDDLLDLIELKLQHLAKRVG